MNKYEELLQATEPARNLLRAQYDPMCEIRITFDRVDVLRGEMGLPFEAARQEPGSIMRDAIFGSHPYKHVARTAGTEAGDPARRPGRGKNAGSAAVLPG